MSQLSHESLTVYQRSIEFVAWATNFTNEHDVKGVVLDQFKRAMISISLNIAEGAGKHYGKDQARFYDVARGSALECGACLDVLVAMQIAHPTVIQPGKFLLIEIVAMLTSLARAVVADRVNEDEELYQF
jgi:four helix bundle protein